MPASAALLCLIVAIADGDTLTARCGQPGEYQQVKVRVGAIDAPEKRQAFGERSRQSLAELCHQQEAKLVERARDRYGRTVADVECRGRDAGQHQVSTGMAWVFNRYAKGYEHLYPLQRAAQQQRLGLWTDPAPMAPWDWRRHLRAQSRGDRSTSL